MPGIVACKLKHEQVNPDKRMSKFTEKFENRQRPRRQVIR
jgi:hypothetical protein